MNREIKLPDIRPALQSLVNELRARKLLPVVAVLVVALIAIPVALSSGGGTPNVAPLPAVPPIDSASVASPSQAVPAVNENTAPSTARISGKSHDPFIQQTLPASQVATTPAAASSHASSGSTGSAAAASSDTASSSAASTTTKTVTVTTTTPAGSTTTPHIVYFDYAAKLTFGQQGTTPRAWNNVQRVLDVPSSRYASVVFVGLASAGKVAEFLLPAREVMAGSGSCHPNREECELLTLKLGQSEKFLLASPEGKPAIYVLRFAGVKLVRTKNPSQSTKTTSKANQKLLHKFSSVLDQVRTTELVEKG